MLSLVWESTCPPALPSVPPPCPLCPSALLSRPLSSSQQALCLSLPTWCLTLAFLSGGYYCRSSSYCFSEVNLRNSNPRPVSHTLPCWSHAADTTEHVLALWYLGCPGPFHMASIASPHSTKEPLSTCQLINFNFVLLPHLRTVHVAGCLRSAGVREALIQQEGDSDPLPSVLFSGEGFSTVVSKDVLGSLLVKS